MLDDFAIRGHISSIESALWAFKVSASASSQKVGRKDLPPTIFFFLISSPPETIISNDEVGEAGRLAGEWVEEGVITGSFLTTSLAFFLDNRPLTVPPLAFFS